MRLILACFIAILAIPGFAQINTKLIKPDSYIRLKLEPDTTALSSRINISRLTILDSRDDSSNIGYHNYKTILKFYSFKSGFNNELNDWYSHYLNINEENKTGTTLLVNVKKLRLSNEIAAKQDEDGNPGQPHDGWDDGLRIKIEYYLQKDSFYTPLYRFDSIIACPVKFKNMEDYFITSALRTSLNKLFTINLDAAVLSRNKIQMGDIIRVNNQRYDFPVYNSNHYKKGVYKTFEEFKMNMPSLPDFEFKRGAMGDIIYITDNNVTYPSREVWGYCDGENIYINSGDKYSKLVRAGNYFYFEGIKSISRKTKHDFWKSSAFNYATDTGLKSTTFTKETRYYQVDMEDGEVY